MRLIVLALVACRAATPTEPAPPELQFDVAAVDRTVDPCGDFYEFACGGWRKSHPIPPDRSRWSRYAELQEQNLARVRGLVASAPGRVGTYYAACMDEAGIERAGMAPIADLLAAVDRLQAPADFAPVLAQLRRAGVIAFATVYVRADRHDVRRTMLAIDSGELGLADPDDYTRQDPESAAIRTKYTAHVARTLALIGDRDAADAPRVVALELALARALPNAVERRHGEEMTHAMPLAELVRLAPATDWPRLLRGLGLEPPAEVDVIVPAELAAVDAALADLTAVRAELRYRIARTFARLLPRALDAEVFDFAARTLHGIRQVPARWKRCLAFVDRDLGDEVGKVFVARYFPPASRARARAMVDRIVGALHRDLAAAEWLGEPARAAALAKLQNMRFTIGYADHWASYDKLVVRAGDPVGNAARGQAVALDRELAKLGKPTDRDEFFALPQSLDGFGTNSLVSVGFTAGFLQPPVFDARLDDAVNFGGFGGVIGHEITHHFDDAGRRFDVDGNIAPWWSDADVAHYQERAACFVDEYARFAIDDGTHLDGKLTLGENLADNGGLRLSWDALQPAFDGPAIDGFTPAQRFFLAWGQIRCENATPEAARNQVHGDPHSPGRFRVDGVVANMPEYARAFGCRAPANPCRLW